MKTTLNFFILALTSFFIFSCQVKTKSEPPRKLPLETFVSDFMDNHPSYFNNDVTKEECDTIFKKMLENSIDSLHLFEGLPIQLEAITQDDNGKLIAQFRCVGFQTKFEYQDSIKEVMFDMWGEIPETAAKELKEKTDYMFYGKFVSFLPNYAMACVVSNNPRPTVWTPLINIRPDDIFEEQVEVRLGMSYWEIDSIVPFRDRE